MTRTTMMRSNATSGKVASKRSPMGNARSNLFDDLAGATPAVLSATELRSDVPSSLAWIRQTSEVHEILFSSFNAMLRTCSGSGTKLTWSRYVAEFPPAGSIAQARNAWIAPAVLLLDWLDWTIAYS
jgi:hypothetical protein